MSEESNVFDAIRDSLVGGKSWLEVRGQKFTTSEARQAQDFHDYLISREDSLEEEDLIGVIGEHGLSVGLRLCLAEFLPLDNLGQFVLCEEDTRIIKVAKARVDESTGKQSGIIIP